MALAVASLASLCGTAGAAEALSSTGTQTDATIMADHRGYQAQQAAIKALNDSGQHPLRSYSLAKAQCWLDVSFHEYTRNDRSAFPQAALDESARITAYLSAGGAIDAADNPARRTPLVNGAPELRPDLWLQAARLKTHAGARCAERLIACAEVELVHAGNEHAQQGWRHAKPYVQMAEDGLAEAEAAAQACPGPILPPVAPAPVPAPVVCPAQPVGPAGVPVPVPPPAEPQRPVTTVEKIVLDASMLFKFDRRTANDLLPTAQSQLDLLVTKLNTEYQSVERVELVGYTDRLGRDSYNLKLSQDRANAMKSVLQSKGVTAQIIAIGRGNADPLVQCPGSKQTPALVLCLQPNRRVEFNITGVRR